MRCPTLILKKTHVYVPGIPPTAHNLKSTPPRIALNPPHRTPPHCHP